MRKVSAIAFVLGAAVTASPSVAGENHPIGEQQGTTVSVNAKDISFVELFPYNGQPAQGVICNTSSRAAKYSVQMPGDNDGTWQTLPTHDLGAGACDSPGANARLQTVRRIALHGGNRGWSGTVVFFPQ